MSILVCWFHLLGSAQAATLTEQNQSALGMIPKSSHA
jgi:hypothetical protein